MNLIQNLHHSDIVIIKSKAKKILVVDDSETVRNLISQILRVYSVTVAFDGQDAFEKCNKQSFHLVVTGQKMPRMDGITLMSNLRLLSSYQIVPFIILGTESSKQNEARLAGTIKNPTQLRGKGLTWIDKSNYPNLLLNAVKTALDTKL